MDVDQDFRLKYVGSSWVGKRGRSAEILSALAGTELNFANSTSFAIHDVVDIIRRSRSNVLWKRMFKAGLIALPELNRRRASIGLAPVSPTYMRRFVPLDGYLPSRGYFLPALVRRGASMVILFS